LNLINHLKENLLGFSRIEVGEMLDENRSPIGYEAVVFDLKGFVLGGGMSSEREAAIKIAASEALERSLVRDLSGSPDKADFGFPEYATGCGFAYGFTRDGAQTRAICEAVERWVWTEWIENQKVLEEVAESPKSPFVKYLRQPFDKIRFFKKSVKLQDVPSEFSKIEVRIVLGYKDGGIFPGSEAWIVEGHPFSHASGEAFRHLRAAQSLSKREEATMDLPERRLLYFSENARVADAMISSCKEEAWLPAKLKILAEAPTNSANSYLFRAICEDHKSWHLGGVKRFAI